MRAYKVTLKDGRTHYFTSLAAIYSVLTRDDIGCGVSNLWNRDVRSKGYRSKRCTIEVIELISQHR